MHEYGYGTSLTRKLSSRFLGLYNIDAANSTMLVMHWMNRSSIFLLLLCWIKYNTHIRRINKKLKNHTNTQSFETIQWFDYVSNGWRLLQSNHNSNWFYFSYVKLLDLIVLCIAHIKHSSQTYLSATLLLLSSYTHTYTYYTSGKKRWKSYERQVETK